MGAHVYCDRALQLSAADGAVQVDVAKMGVRARRQVSDRNSPSGLRDMDTYPGSIEARFARRATELYDQLAANEAPEFERVRQIAKALAVASWLKDSGIRIDVNTLVPILNRAAIKGVDRISVLEADRQQVKSIPITDGKHRGARIERRHARVTGGVDLTAKPQLTIVPRLMRLRDTVAQAVASHPGAPMFDLEHGGQHFVATVMPFTLEISSSERSGKASR